MWKKLKNAIEHSDEQERKYDFLKTQANGLRIVDYDLYKHKRLERFMNMYIFIIIYLTLAFCAGVMYAVTKLAPYLG